MKKAIKYLEGVKSRLVSERESIEVCDVYSMKPSNQIEFLIKQSEIDSLDYTITILNEASCNEVAECNLCNSTGKYSVGGSFGNEVIMDCYCQVFKRVL